MDIAVDFSGMERFLLQPVKSGVLQIHVLNHLRRTHIDDTVVTMKEQPMPVVKEAMHIRILRSADTQESAVSHTIQKARRTVYSLMGSGLHGENGLDPETIYLLQTYVLPVLVYGLEVVLPKTTLVGTEPPLPGYYQYFLGSKCALLKDTTRFDPSGA